MKHISERESQLPPAEIAKLIQIAAEHKEIISLGPGEPDFPAPVEIVNYTRQIAGSINHYSPPVGRRELSEAIVKKVKKDNKIKTSTDNVIVTTGSSEGLLLAMLSSVCATEQVIIPDPGYMGYLPSIELCDAVPVPLHIKEEHKFEPDPDEIKKLINEKTSAIILNTPGNPTGNVMKKRTLEEIADIAVEKEIYVFSDEAYEHIVYDKAKHVSIGSFNGMEEYVVSFFTFSKSFAMCGYRVGYAIGPKDLIAAMTKVHTDTTICAPTISQMLAVKALEMPRTYTQKMVSEYKRRRNLIVKRLNEIGLKTHKPDGAFYAFANIQDYSKDSIRFTHQLIDKAKVATVPGAEFGTHGEGFIRFSYATKYELIEKAMDNIEKFLKTKK